MNWKKTRVFLSFLLVPVAYLYIFSNVNISTFFASIRGSNLFLLFLAFLLIFFEYFLMAIRWKEIVGEKDIFLPLMTSYRFLLISMFMNKFLPLRGGDFYKGHISTGDKNFFESSVLVLKDRFLDLFVILLISLVLSLLFFSEVLYVILVGVFFFACFTGFVVFIFKVRNFPFFKERYSRIRSSVMELLNTEKTVYLVLFTFVIWFFGILRVIIILRALGIHKGWIFATFITFLWAILSTIPITPSGMGSTEAIVFGFLVRYGITPEAVGSYVVVNRAIPLIASIFVGGGLYIHENINDNDII